MGDFLLEQAKKTPEVLPIFLTYNIGTFTGTLESPANFTLGDQEPYVKNGFTSFYIWASYMDPPNAREALREIALDVAEGADIVMIKPGLPYLDVLRAARERFDVPLAVYNVSGEYAMLKAAAANGWLDEEPAVDEVLTSFVRAGADIVITYFAREYAQRLG